MIVIASLTKEYFNSGFTFDLVNLIRKEPDTLFLVAEGTLLCNQRTDLVKNFLKTDATHILFIDSDMRFPDTVLRALLSAKKDIIGANCLQRKKRIPTAVINEEPITSTNQTGLQEVDSLGFGVILIDRVVFETIPEVWFATPYDGEKFVGEDRYFCHIAKQRGFQIWIDHDLSQAVGHCGIVEQRF
jgi:hypothetical protein